MREYVMIMTHKTNVQLLGLIDLLRENSRKQDAHIWNRIASDLAKPTRQRRLVNIYKLNKYTKENETVIVPGKVLGTGEILHKLNVAAFSFSDGAKEKIIKAKGQCFTIPELLQKNPKGQDVKILG